MFKYLLTVFEEHWYCSAISGAECPLIVNFITNFSYCVSPQESIRISKSMYVHNTDSENGKTPFETNGFDVSSSSG